MRIVKYCTYKGTSVASLLGVAFIVLKLTGYIDWSWLWVLAPFWVPVSIALVFLIICLLIVFFGAIKRL